jgi:hypothetical protein
MYAIHNQQRQLIGYFYKNMILNTAGTQVCGIVLGNCIFGNAPTCLGKYFNNTFRNYGCEILATTTLVQEGVELNNTLHLEKQAWQFVTAIKDHNDQWIEEKSTWSPQNLMEVLAGLGD